MYNFNTETYSKFARNYPSTNSLLMKNIYILYMRIYIYFTVISSPINHINPIIITITAIQATYHIITYHRPALSIIQYIEQ